MTMTRGATFAVGLMGALSFAALPAAAAPCKWCCIKICIGA